MEMEKATYSYNALQECANMVKQTTWSVTTKRDHVAKCIEVKNIFNYCLEKTGCVNFETEYNVAHDYMHAVTLKLPVKQLNTLLKRCYFYLAGEINGIHECMINGEVNAID